MTQPDSRPSLEGLPTDSLVGKYVLIFTLGPVQSFIEEARRTGDLYGGSRLLVELMQRALDTVQQHGGTLVYPRQRADSSLPNRVVHPRQRVGSSLPNRFVAVVGDAAAGERVAEAVRQQLKETAAKVLPVFTDKDETFFNIWNRQIDNHLETYWACASIESEDGYVAAYQRASGVLAARKRTRDFAQVEEGGFKDSLSGQRAALRTSSKDGKRYWEGFAAASHKPWAVNEEERLDALAAIKRFANEWLGEEQSRFPSVSTIAATPYLNRAKGTDELKALEDELRKAPKFYQVGDFGRGFFPYDGDLLYAETYAKRRLKASYGIDRDSEAKAARQALESLYKAMGKRGGPSRPNTYYAVLTMDGDLMGQHVSRCGSRDEQAQVSESLGRFAASVQDIAVKHGGLLVYSGGDDVLALFPLEEALPAARELATAYRRTMNRLDQTSDGESFPYTISAGMAIAHHLFPLGSTLQAAREARDEAKDRYGRNAICVRVLKRAGSYATVGGKWRLGPGEVDTVEMVQQAVRDLKEEQLAGRFVYDLEAELTAFASSNATLCEPLIRRLVKRHTPTGKTPVTSAEKLVGWIDAFDKEEPEADRGGVGELKEWLLLASFIARGGGE